MIDVNTESKFKNEMIKIFKEYRPKYILETGTYLGQGTSTIIWNALQANNIEDYIVTTIEVNPERQQSASAYFKTNQMNIISKLGVSIPKNYLLNKSAIQTEFVDNKEFTNEKIYYDHDVSVRTELYYSETNFDVDDDIIGKTLTEYDYQLDFALLDSAGHLGWIEFNYLMSIIKNDCILMLDDVNHCKHQKTLNHMKQNPNKFQIIVEDDEKFGFAIIKYTYEK